MVGDRARLHEHERSKGPRNGWGGVARAGAGGGAAWPGRAGAWSYIWRGRRDLELEKLRGRGASEPVGCRGSVAVGGVGWWSACVHGVVGAGGLVLPRRLDRSVWLAGRPVGGGKRTRTQPHVLEDLTTDVAVIFFWLNRIIEN